MFDNLSYLFFAHPRPLNPVRHRRVTGKQQHVALTDQLFGSWLIKDDPRIGEARDGEGHASRHIRFDDSGDHVHRWPLCCDDEVNTDGSRLLRYSGNRLFNVACRNHHEVV